MVIQVRVKTFYAFRHKGGVFFRFMSKHGPCNDVADGEYIHLGCPEPLICFDTTPFVKINTRILESETCGIGFAAYRYKAIIGSNCLRASRSIMVSNFCTITFISRGLTPAIQARFDLQFIQDFLQLPAKLAVHCWDEGIG